MDKKQTYYHPSDRLIDIFVGASDGIIIPFVVISALYGAKFANNTIMIIATIAAAIGGIIMFASTYLTGKHQIEEEGRLTEKEKQIAEEIGLDESIIQRMDSEAAKEKEEYSSYAIEYDLQPASKPVKEITVSAYTIGLSYFIAGMLPTVPFYILQEVKSGFLCSIGITLVFVFILNVYRAKVTEQGVLYSSVRAVVMATVAAWAAYYIAYLF